MEEALDILWTYARREPIESNGKTIVATISQSIAAIRLIMRLEGGLQRGEKRKLIVKNKQCLLMQRQRSQYVVCQRLNV